MTRTTREWCLSLILIGIMFITAILLMPSFGPQPLSNPIAVGIFIAVIIVSCCLLSMNRYITGYLKGYFKSKSRDKKQVTLICPRCNILVEKESGICPLCGNKL